MLHSMGHLHFVTFTFILQKCIMLHSRGCIALYYILVHSGLFAFYTIVNHFCAYSKNAFKDSCMLMHSVPFTALSMIAFLLHSGQMHSATFTMHFTLAACCHGCIINAFDGPSAFRCIHVHSRIVH